MLLSRVLVVVLVWGTVGAGALRILAFLPFNSKSHHMVFDPILRELLHRGHDVVAYKARPLAVPPLSTNYTEIITPAVLTPNMKEDFNFIKMGQMHPLAEHVALNNLGVALMETVLSWGPFQELLYSRQHFDLILDEALFVQEASLVLSHKFNAPQVTMLTLGNSPWAMYLLSNPYNPAYIPDFKVTTTTYMSFYQRLVNTLYVFATIFIGDWYHLPKMQEMVDRLCRYEGWESRPPLSTMVRNISLLVQNSHHSINGAAPLAPNVLSVGGIHIGKNKPLPADLKEWLDGGGEGVVYVSYGSVIEPWMLEEEARETMAAALGRLGLRVIWRNNLAIRNKPSNVYAAGWLPQQDILRHKNCVAFVSHGGYLSMTEAVYHGVPVVGTPFFGDQRKNMAWLVEQGLGVQLDYFNLTQESLLWAIKEVLKPSYRQAMRAKSREFRARPVAALDEALFWLERLGESKNGASLRPSLTSLTWYQALLLDVLLFLVFVTAICLLISNILINLTFFKVNNKQKIL